MKVCNPQTEVTTKFEGAVFLVVVVLAVLSYRYFAGPGDGPGEGGSTRSDPRTTASRGRPVTPAMVEVLPLLSSST